MIYEYKCSFCNRVTDRVCKMDNRDDPFHCLECCSIMTRVPSFNGGLKTEHPAWLDHHVRGAIQEPGMPPITTRTEHDRYCASKGIAHV